MLARMSEIRVGVRVSGDDGARVLRSLEAAGFHVSRLEPGVATQARPRVVVLDVASPAELGAALREWRSTAEGAPPTVIVLGPEGADPEAFAAADAFFRRPVPIAELVRVVRRFLAADRGARGGASDGHPGEPTVRVESRLEPKGYASGRSASGIQRAVGTSPGERTRAHARSRLSPELEAILVAADRRLFPDRTALPFELPGAEALPAELVPDELLAAPVPAARESPPYELVPASFEHPPADREPLEVHDPTQPSVEPDGLEPTFAPEPLATTALLDRRYLAAVVETPAVVDRAGAALLFAVADRTAPHRLSFTDARGRSVALWVAGGAVVESDASADAGALERLRAEGRLAEAEAPDDATAFLEAAVADGLVRRVDADRCRREALEASVADFALGRVTDVRVEESEKPVATVPRTRPVRAIAVEAFRARKGPVLGAREAFFLREGSRSGLASLGLLPEEVAAIHALEGVPSEDLRASAPGVEGLFGLVALFVDLGYAALGPATVARAESSASALRVHLANAAARATDGSYFEILGLDRDADGVAIERARERLRAELSGIDLAALGLVALEGERVRVLSAVDEAYVALRDERLRRAYAAALAAPEGGR